MRPSEEDPGDPDQSPVSLGSMAMTSKLSSDRPRDVGVGKAKKRRKDIPVHWCNREGGFIMSHHVPPKRETQRSSLSHAIASKMDLWVGGTGDLRIQQELHSFWSQTDPD